MFKSTLALTVLGAALCASYAPAHAGDGTDLLKFAPENSQIVMVFDVSDASDAEDVEDVVPFLVPPPLVPVFLAPDFLAAASAASRRARDGSGRASLIRSRKPMGASSADEVSLSRPVVATTPSSSAYIVRVIRAC